ncbi:hypothetical protein M514_03006, partial [Trichuris suis]
MNDDSGMCRTAFETCEFDEHEYHFLLNSYSESCFVWIGKSSAYGDLAIALKRPNDEVCFSTKVIDKTGSPVSEALAMKLAKKTGKQVFVSCNVEMESEEVFRFINQKVFEMSLKLEQVKSNDGTVSLY